MGQGTSLGDQNVVLDDNGMTIGVDMKDMKYNVYRTAEVYRGVDDEGGNAEVVQFVRATESFRGEERRDFCVLKGKWGTQEQEEDGQAEKRNGTQRH